MAWEIQPTEDNLIIEKEEFKTKEGPDVMLPEEQEREMELDEDGLYRVLKTGENVEFVEKGDIIVIPNRTKGKFDLPDGEVGIYVNKDRVIAKIFENE